MRNRLRTGELPPPALAVALLICVLTPISQGLAAEKKEETAPAATVAFMFPAGGQQGQTVEATVVGLGLEGATAVYVSGSGVTATVVPEEKPASGAKAKTRKKPKGAPEPKGPRPWSDPQETADRVRISIVIAPDAEPGMRDLRLIAPLGVSNRCRFMVGQLREQVAVEPNSERDTAVQVESLPAVVNGQIYSGYIGPQGTSDRGYWRVTAKAGQTLVCECQGQSLLPFILEAVPGWQDVCLTLRDADSRRLRYADDFRFKPDPVLFYKVEKDGEYLLEVRDIIYRSDQYFVYRVRIGALPYLTHVFPLGGRRGTDVQVALHGVNLSQDSLNLKVPADSPERRDLSVTENGVRSNLVPFAVGDLPEMLEAESNASVAEANRVTVPVTINGRIGENGDEDYFVFKAEAGQKLLIKVDARRLDSPLDSLLALFDAAGAKLDENDDFALHMADPAIAMSYPPTDFSRTADPRDSLVTHQADSRLVYEFSAAGDYVVRIGDVREIGGEEYAYRLTLAPAQPDYVLRIETNAFRISPGGSAALGVSALRKNGFDGEIKLDVQGLPSGFVTSGGVIPADEDTTQVTVTAPTDATPGLYYPTVVGTAVVGDKTLERKAIPTEPVVAAFYTKLLVPTKDCVMYVEEESSFTLSTDVPPKNVLEIPQGGEAKVVVKVSRKNGTEGAVALAEKVFPVKREKYSWEPKDPPCPEIKAASIPADKAEATVSISVPAKTLVGMRRDMVIGGTMKAGKETTTRTAPAVSVKVIAAK